MQNNKKNSFMQVRIFLYNINYFSKYSFEICEEHDIDCKGYDAIVFVSSNDHEIRNEKLRKSTSEYLKLDPTLKSEIGILPLTGFTTEKLVYAPTGPLDVDYDDVRSLKETAIKGIQRALKAGVKRPLVALEEHAKFPKSELVTLLGILEGLYVVSINKKNKPARNMLVMLIYLVKYIFNKTILI